MIVVIADDLTGAAEIAGIGLQYGLSVALNTDAELNSAVQLLIISADTRSLSATAAERKSLDISSALALLSPEFIFKKIDSVLRGHVLAELEVYMRQMKKTKALLVPGNPLLGRTIVNGFYFINGVPVHLTSFAHDPEFAVKSSNVLEMLGANKTNNVHFINKERAINGEGIFIGDVLVNDDLQVWSEKVDDTMLLAGGANFFASLLAARNFMPVETEKHYRFQYTGKKLYISGTAFENSVAKIQQVAEAGGPVIYLPEAFFNQPEKSEILAEEWSDSILAHLQQNEQVIMAVKSGSSISKQLSPVQLSILFATTVAQVFKRQRIQEIIIEGGATAAAVLKELGFGTFKPLQVFAQGVIRMESLSCPDIFITMKPGSYDWPTTVWNF
jgi:uncharacterized protein YgbK (DUF1537 family)